MTQTPLQPLPRDYQLKRNLLLLACFLTLFLFLGLTLFNTRGEPREAVVALSMLKEGNWVLPINNGVDLAYKPPFFHWLAALCSLPFGTVTEYTSRLPSALALTVMVMAGFRFYARRTSSATALLMGLLTLTSFEVHRAGVACRVDMVLTCMMVLSLYALYCWAERGLRGVPWAAVLCLSGAFLSKGPVGLALPCLVAAVFGWMRGMGFWRVTLRISLMGILALVLPAAWYVAAWQQGGDRFLHLIYEENVLRLLGKMTYESHVNPWTYNVLTIITGMLPYTLLGLLALPVLRWRKPACWHPSAWWGQLKKKLREMDTVRLFTLLSLVIVFAFYCIPKSKRSVYLLPVYPFICFYVAEAVQWLADRKPRIISAFNGVLGVLAGVLTLAFIAVRCHLVPDTVMGSGSHAVQNAAMLHALSDTPLGLLQLVAVSMPVVVLIAALYVRKHPGLAAPRMRPLLMAAQVASIFFALDGAYQPLVLNVKSDKPVAEYINSLQPEGRIYSFRTDVVEGNAMHPFTVNFYLGDRVMPFEAANPREGLLIVGNDEVTEFARRHPALNVQLVKDFRHTSCDDHKQLKLYRFTPKPTAQP